MINNNINEVFQYEEDKKKIITITITNNYD